MEKITITRALVERKTLMSRIEKAIQELTPVASAVKGKIRHETITDFEDKAKTQYQSILDLIQRRLSIKQAIIKSNATTLVLINRKSLTVAEAIVLRDDIKKETHPSQILCKRLSTKFTTAAQNMELDNNTMRRNLDELLKITFKKDSTKVKEDEYNAVAKPYTENNESTLINPLKADVIAKQIEDDLAEFSQEVDICLTESNSRTEIEI
jgi:hypothetical protein